MYKTLKQILEDNSSSPTPIIDNGILLDGTILLIVGPAKSKKTFLTLNIALAIASGTDFAGFKISKPRKVLYLLAEGGYYPNRKRITKMAQRILPGNTDNFMVEFSTNSYINDFIGYDELYRMIEGSGAEVVIFDPLIRFHDIDENSATGMSEVFGKIRMLIDNLSISVILNHHTGKVESKGGRGSSVILGEYDSCISIHKAKNNFIRLTYIMRHVETPPSNSIRFNSDTFWFERDNGIIEQLENFGGTIPKEDFINNYGKSKATAYRDIIKAVKEGHIKDEGGVLELVDLE